MLANNVSVDSRQETLPKLPTVLLMDTHLQDDLIPLVRFLYVVVQNIAAQCNIPSTK